ncbi:MAG TPA: thiamine pyrophosphate-dependent enzyme [Syntrophales bacterium]|nr:thiamine pyrophosphate-dependent enzyme [Syntrophales bacterium]
MVWVGNREIAWCPGCGNFPIRTALESVLKELPVPPQKIVLTSGIGQAAKMPHYLDTNFFNGLHGRALPLAVGIKIARPDLTVIAVSGDGCNYGEGGNHFIHTIRKNLDLTILTHDNKVYALTKGQSAPTTDRGTMNNLDPQGNENRPFNPLAAAIVMGAPFVARGSAGDPDHLKEVLKEAILFKGTAVVDIFQPCVTFNHINTYQWYKDRVYRLGKPLPDRYEALKTAEIWGERIPIGVIFRDEGVMPRQSDRIIFREPPEDKALGTMLSQQHFK